MKKAESKKVVMKSQRIFDVIGYIILVLTSMICVLPFWLIVSGSFTANDVIVREGFSVLPKEPTLAAYQHIFEAAQSIGSAYAVTIKVTLIGTFIGLVVISLTGFVLSRKEFKYRNRISFLIYFTTMFSGGLVPYYYVMCGVLNLKGTLTAQWL